MKRDAFKRIWLGKGGEYLTARIQVKFRLLETDGVGINF